MVALLEGGCRMKDSQVKLQIVLSKLAKDKFLVRVHERVISGACGPDVSIYLKIQSLKCESISMSACKLICISTKLQEVLGRTNLPTFPICHLCEVLEPNLMELNLSDLTLTSFNSI
jgi:hypothetical protein